MRIKLGSGHRASEDDLNALEKELGHRLPSDFRRFLKQYDGAEPEPNIMETNPLVGINRFIPVRFMLDEKRVICSLSKTLIPIAWASCGNYVLLDAADGKVVFWDHETDRTHALATSFAAFIDSLRPFSARDESSNAVNVRRVWFDPNFLTELHERPSDESKE